MTLSRAERSSILVVAGTTASGKTAAAIELAKRYSGELIAADSVQVYREFDIGSAKPTADELGGIPHHLLGILAPDATIDAVEYAGLADSAIADVHARGKLPIVVGGTGLWLRALVRGLVPLPPADRALRARLEAEADAVNVESLHARLSTIDPAAAAAIHPRDRMRIVRALEVFEQTGIPLGEHQARHALGAPRYDALFVVLDASPEDHRHAIEVRTHAMLDAGWIAEVASIVARYGEAIRPLGSVGYRQIVEHLRDAIPLDETIARIVKATRVYARRQRTWWRSEPGIDWHTSSAALVGPEGREKIERWLATSGRAV